MSELAINGGPKVRTKPWPVWPPSSEMEKEQLLDVLESRSWGGYPSPNRKAKEFGEKFAAYTGAKYGVCCANGTVSLEMCLRAAGLKYGDEVIVPPYTWVATATAVVTTNGVPVFADVKAEDYTLDPDIVEAKITDKTKAIIPVHLGSSAADMDRFMEIAAKHNLIIIEDCAHAHGAKWNGVGLGSIGHFGSFSFQSSKLMTSGEGGLVLTNDEEFNMKLHSLVNCGRKESGYSKFDGWLVGWNYRIGEFQAGVLLAQLAALDERTRLRMENAAYFTEQLRQIDGIEVIERDPRLTPQHHYQYIFKFHPEGFKGLHRNQFLQALYAEGVEFDGPFYEAIPGRDEFPVTADYYPAIRERYGEAITEAHAADCPVTQKATFDEAVWVHYPYLMGTKQDIDDIITAIRKIQENVDELL
ncbi:MAG: DegT/DnrJ/EryC1/StrS family aminotransferase [Candidatus Lernaella stagnicola]|nr:DegT/DnrJ/EryC1/StrS family aminotransferase [Candidatus Lernaella stagnicola]